MAVGHVLFNDATPYGAKLRGFLSDLERAFDSGNDLLLLFAQMKDTGAVGQYLATQFGFGLPRGSNIGTAGVIADAEAGVAEIESLMAKLNTTGAATATVVKDAILQAIAKFG
jgi:hypothetical protein